ncbi:MAG: hypothetical protein K2P81_17850 [Bacteriovoracaceae bacterium]|nr:hypothetical protein [Bacteriovoracaceae bacterium]
MDIYEDKVVLHPRFWKGVISKRWKNSLVLPYSQIQRVEITKKMWPMPHQFTLHTKDESITFNFKKLYAFFERLHVYVERQIILFYNKPNGLPPAVKTVVDIVEERKKKKKQRPEPSIAA